MNTEDFPYRKVHHGHNVKRWREITGMKQEILAEGLGLSQQTVSRLEMQEKIDDETLQKIAQQLNTTVEILKNFDEEKAINIVSNTFQGEKSVGGVMYNPTFNPLDKVVELYELIIKEKDERIKFLEQSLAKYIQD